MITPPPPPATSFTLQFLALADDGTTAQALGWGQGIPEVEVTLTPQDSGLGGLRTLRGGPEGRLDLEGIPAGRYAVRAARWLTETERARLPAGDDAVGFVGSFPLTAPLSSSPTEARLPASRRRGLVLSEWAGVPLFTAATGTYFFSGYLRLYNNADTTLYLDGLIVGSAFAQQFDLSPNFPCSSAAPLGDDPLGVWAAWFQRLPGTGRDFPLAPGAAALLATDAIDHRSLAPGGLDLRAADFEYIGGADVDNPAVANAPEVSIRPVPLGHGLIFSALANVVFVSLPLDPATLPRAFQAGAAGAWARFPKETLLEVVGIKTTFDNGRAACPVMVHPSLDREPVKLLGAKIEDALLAHRRLALPFSIGGRAVLQHTLTSAADFGVADRTPFAKP